MEKIDRLEYIVNNKHPFKRARVISYFDTCILYLEVRFPLFI